MKTLRLASTTALVAFAPLVYSQTLFMDRFDIDTSAGWSVKVSDPDTAAVFHYDYGVDGIPSAPHSVGGTTWGLKFSANMAAPGVTAGLSASPLGQKFTGDYVLRYDLWMNANGPFPGGNVGSTQFASAGIGLASDTLVWSGSAPDGQGWFAVSGEGGSAQDFRAFVSSTQQPDSSGVYAAGTTGFPTDDADEYYATTFPGGQAPPALQQANYSQQTGSMQPGTVGFAWRDVSIAKVGNQVTWAIDGLPIATLDVSSSGISTEGNIFVGYFDPFSSVTDNAALTFGVVDNVRVELVPEPSILALGMLGFGALAWMLRRT